jgi:tetratricopeptide (TPR) repeat protein
MGRLEEAISEMQRAVELDPLSPIINTNLGWPYLFARQYDRAIEQFRKALELDPDFGPTHLRLREVYEAKGMFKEAIEEFTKAGFIAETAEATAELREAYARRGAQGYWGKSLELRQKRAKQSYVPPSDMAELYAQLGEKDRAFEWLERALADRDEWMRFLKVSPSYDSLRSDPRFPDLLRRMSLPP